MSHQTLITSSGKSILQKSTHIIGRVLVSDALRGTEMPQESNSLFLVSSCGSFLFSPLGYAEHLLILFLFLTQLVINVESVDEWGNQCSLALKLKHMETLVLLTMCSALRPLPVLLCLELVIKLYWLQLLGLMDKGFKIKITDWTNKLIALPERPMTHCCLKLSGHCLISVGLSMSVDQFYFRADL